jgi:hypothetical protein
MDFAVRARLRRERSPLIRMFRTRSGFPLPSISFNWRGRTSSCTTTFAIFTDDGQSWVDVSDAGEVTIDSDVDVLPTVTYAACKSNESMCHRRSRNRQRARTIIVSIAMQTASGVAGPPASGGGPAAAQVDGQPLFAFLLKSKEPQPHNQFVRLPAAAQQ